MNQLALNPTAPPGVMPRSVPRLIAILGALASFECTFILFIFAGQYKSDPRFEFLPCDATLFFGMVNAAQALVLFFDRRFRPNLTGVPVLIAGVVFAGFLMLSTRWAMGYEYAKYKALCVGTINLWCLFAASIIISSSHERLIRFVALLNCFAAWIGAECLLFYAHHSQFGRVMQLHAMAGESAYIGLGRVVTWGGLAMAVVWMFAPRGAWPLWNSRALSAGAAIYFFLTASMIGARGPIVAAVLSLIVVGCLYSESARRRELITRNLGRFFLTLTGVLAAVLAWKARTGEYPLIVQRFLAFSSNSQYYDGSGQSTMRLEMYEEAFFAWLEKPVLGWGSGGFSIIWENIDQRLFPHNLILEVLCETGVVGLGLFAAIPLLAIVRAKRAHSKVPPFYAAMGTALALSAFLNTMTSGDLPDNRYFFFGLGLLAFRFSPQDARARDASQSPATTPRAAPFRGRPIGATASA